MDFWKNKLAAYLHDPPSKALEIYDHEGRSEAAFRQAGFTGEDVGKYMRRADHAAAAADRLPFPESRASGLRSAFDGVRNAFHHPLAKSEGGDGMLAPFHAVFPSVDLGVEGEQSVQPVLGDLSEVPEAQHWRARFFAHWRLWPSAAQSHDYRLGLLPADTRIPDHTIWNHMSVVSALSSCTDETDEAGEHLRPAFLRLQIGPVQEFIAAARSTRDLWSGSYLLSWLMAAGLKALSAEIGPDSVIFPNLRGQPLFDFHWKKELWGKVRMAKGAKTVWDSDELGHTKQDLLTPNLPNVFLAVVPADRAEELGACVKFAIEAEWRKIATSVLGHCQQAGGGSLFADEGAGLTQKLREDRFTAQTEAFLSISWRATEWPDTLAEALTLANEFEKDMPISKATERVQRVVDMATKEMSLDDRDYRYYVGGKSGAKTELNNIGLGWSIMVAANAWELDAVRQTRGFTGWKQSSIGSNGGTGVENNKDALNGRDEAVAGGHKWASRCNGLGEEWGTLFKKNDWIGAVTLIKRLWHIAYLRRDDVLGDFVGKADFRKGSTRGIAMHEPFEEDLDPEDGKESDEKYFAVLAFDGDEIGKWVSGEKASSFGTQLSAYSDAGKEVEQGAKVYFGRPDFSGKSLKKEPREKNGPFLKTQKPLSPGYHLQFSEALSNFALQCARPIVDAHDGVLIYAGGDDVVALLPADTALKCAQALRTAFQGNAVAFPVPRKEKVKINGEEKVIEIRGFDSFAPGFLTRADRIDNINFKPVPFMVPGPNAEASVGIAMAHFKAPLQDVVRAAQAAEKTAKRKPLDRGAVAVSLFKRSGEILEWGCKWGGGGLELFDLIFKSLRDNKLSGKFPHRIAELLSPYLLTNAPISAMQRATGFDSSAIIEREFIHAIERQTVVKGTDKETLKSELISALQKYLAQIPDEKDDMARAIIGLCQAVAFAHRTAKERK